MAGPQLLGPWETGPQPTSSCLLGFSQARSSSDGWSPSVTRDQGGQDAARGPAQPPRLPTRQQCAVWPQAQEQRQVGHCTTSAILHRTSPVTPWGSEAAGQMGFPANPQTPSLSWARLQDEGSRRFQKVPQSLPPSNLSPLGGWELGLHSSDMKPRFSNPGAWRSL